MTSAIQNLIRGDVMIFSRIRDLREDADRTQEEIAKILNMKREVYRRYETGIREIPVWAVIKLAEYYKTSTDYILGLSNKK
jgi:transcriptional regulator with XRE-family HTH domain